MLKRLTRTSPARKSIASQLVLAGVASLALANCTTVSAATPNQESAMTANNSDVIGKIYESFGKGDIEGVLSVMDENVVWLHPGSKEDIPFAGEFVGVAGVREFFVSAGSNIDVLEQEVFSTVSEGDRVLVLGRERMRVKATGREYDSNWIHAYTLRDGKVVRFEEFIDTAQMKDAFAQN